ncbi:MAG: class I SAM-dependent methyltransferase [Candidatus Diapherotrites archaeon]|nr:class I SAM-dependent methyltransferase [Candidatus Diapherotrites archaeon]
MNEKEFFEDFYARGKDAWQIFSNRLRTEKFEQRAQTIKGLIEKHAIQGKGLDIGCGEGFIEERLGLKVIGLEISLEALKRARREKRMQDCVNANAVRLPFKDKAFNFILLLETLYYHDARALLQEARRVCKKKGRIVLTVGNKNDAGRLLRRAFGKQDEDIIYSANKKQWGEKKYSLRELMELAEMHGFKVLGIKGILLNIPWMRRSTWMRRNVLFPLGNAFKPWASQVVLVGEKR